MLYSDIIPTHNSLRKPASFKAMINNPSIIWDAEKHPLLLRFPDGKLYLNDGHHRLAAATWLNLPINKINFDIMDLTYDDMLEVNFETDWLTPYDPRTHVRTNDCLKFKNQAREIIKNSGRTAGYWYIQYHKQDYLEERKAFNLKDLFPS